MSAILIVGIPLITITAIALCQTELIALIKEVVNLLVRTTNYTTEKILQIIHIYF